MYRQALNMFAAWWAVPQEDRSCGRKDAVPFRVPLPLGTKPGNAVAADGQMGCILKVYRDWRICGDDRWLASLWPKVKMALAFAWIPAEKWRWNAKWRQGGWDVGKSGLMDGEQHNTMDVNYYGLNPQMGFWYLGALRAAEEMVFQGMDEDAVKVVKAVRDRHDGLKRNPFSEPECGHNYARSMASWNCLLAWLKMHNGDVNVIISR